MRPAQTLARSTITMITVLLAIGVALSAKTSRGAGLEISRTPTGLRAVGITSGGDAVWFGDTIDAFVGSRLLRRHASVMSDSDRDGVVEYAIAPISRFAFFAVVDFSTGKHAVYRGEGVAEREIELRGNQWRAGLQHMDIEATYLDVLLVRPRSGAWCIRAAEGNAADADESLNGKFRLSLKNMAALSGTEKAPPAARADDVLIMIDPRSLEYFIKAAKE